MTGRCEGDFAQRQVADSAEVCAGDRATEGQGVQFGRVDAVADVNARAAEGDAGEGVSGGKCPSGGVKQATIGVAGAAGGKCSCTDLCVVAFAWYQVIGGVDGDGFAAAVDADLAGVGLDGFKNGVGARLVNGDGAGASSDALVEDELQVLGRGDVALCEASDGERCGLDREFEGVASGALVSCKIGQGVGEFVGAFAQGGFGSEGASIAVVGGLDFDAVDIQGGCVGQVFADEDARGVVVGGLGSAGGVLHVAHVVVEVGGFAGRWRRRGVDRDFERWTFA